MSFLSPVQNLSQTWSGLSQTQQIATGAVLAVSSFWLWRKASQYIIKFCNYNNVYQWIAGGVNKHKPDLTGKASNIFRNKLQRLSLHYYNFFKK